MCGRKSASRSSSPPTRFPKSPTYCRCGRCGSDLDLFDFKEEVPKILHTITFLYSLKDEQLTKGKIKSSLLQYYKRAVAEAPPGEHTYAFVERFLTGICSAVLVAKVLPGANISLNGVLKPVIEKGETSSRLSDLG